MLPLPVCRNVKNFYLIRHAQCTYNAKCHMYPHDQIYSKQAEDDFHFDISMIDSPLTADGIKALNSLNFAHEFAGLNKRNTTIFVSPLTRALQTARILINNHKMESFKVFVLPEFSEILSKICDFADDTHKMREIIPQLDLTYFTKWIESNNLQLESNWQDPFIVEELKYLINTEVQYGYRYLKILRKMFPKKIQPVRACKKRTSRGVKISEEVASSFGHNNIMIISHNRVLKNIEENIIATKPQDFENLELKIFRNCQ